MTAASLLANALSDRYEVVRELARGGMGTVYLARDLKHDRPVALKVLHPELAGTVGSERFLREIRTAASLHHPHILAVLDSGEVAGSEPGTKLLWFTMPFVEGESLRERLRREPRLPLEVALQITREAARGLDWAHQHGIIHRDIKPENILLTKDGATLVADFGIARPLGAADRLTQIGWVIGTPAYMSPERATGDQGVDPRTDVYSLGAVAYEMLAGEVPLTGPTTQEMVTKRLTEPVPSVRVARPDVPEAVDQAIQRALAPAAAKRFADAGEFARALQTSGRTSSAPAVVRPAALSRRAVPVLGTLIGALLLVLAMFAWRHWWGSSDAATAGRTRVLAVLPFENLGDTSDAYFAGGLTDEVRAKLARVPGLEVIARGSSNEYRDTQKSAEEIARELGVDYLLTGTVRWDKSPGGASRVRVIPELVEIRPGQAPRTKWQEPFEAALTSVFDVQAGIAGKVASALGVALADSVRGTLASRPTASLAAYDDFLKGEAASQGLIAHDPAGLRRALGFYEQAVALDPSFVPAWAQLSRASTLLFASGAVGTPLREKAGQAAQKALALGPGRPETYLALGAYYRGVQGDSRRALAIYDSGLRLAPNNVDLLAAAGVTEQDVGRWDSALAHLKRAAALDPRSARAASRYAVVLVNLRRHAEAERAIDRAVGLAPTAIGIFHDRVVVAVAGGDLDEARRLVRAAPAGIDSTALIAYLATFEDLWWVLDDAQQRRLLTLPPSAFDGSRATWGLVLAQVLHHRGEPRKARAYADSAVLGFERELRDAPDDGQERVLFGLALAYAGRAADAVREGERGLALQQSRDGPFGHYIEQQVARIYLLIGEPDKALDRLEPLLAEPSMLSPGWLRIDPTWDALRQQPRFHRLVGGG